MPFLGEVPIDVRVREGGDQGFPFVLDPDSGSLGDAFRVLAGSVVAEIRRHNRRSLDTPLQITL